MTITIEQAKEFSVQAYNPLLAEIKALQDKYKGVVYDMDTHEGVNNASREVKEFKSLFNKIDKARLEIKRPILEIGNEIDRIGHEYKLPLKTRIDELSAPIAIFAEKEQIRIDGIESRINAIKALPMQLLGKTAEYIRERQQELIETDANGFEEFNHVAKKALDEVIAQIQPILEDRERLESAEAKQHAIAEQTRIDSERIAEQQRLQQAKLDEQQKIIDDERNAIQLEKDRLAKEQSDRELAESMPIERQEAVAEAENDHIERERIDAEQQAKDKALMPEIDSVVAWLESIIESAPIVHDERLARLVTSVKAASNNHIRAFKEAK